MVDFSDKKKSEGKIGLELDKMEIPKIAPTAFVKKKADRGVQEIPSAKKDTRKPPIFRILLLISGVALPFVLIYFLWDQGFVDLPYLKSRKAERVLKRFETVGPVMTSIGQNHHVKLTVMVECKNAQLKNKLTHINSALKDKLVVALSAPEAKEKLRVQDYDALKSYLKREIDSLLRKESVEAVYFSDIIFY